MNSDCYRRHLFLQVASVCGQRRWKEWAVSHHLRLWDCLQSRLQILLPGGEKMFQHFCFTNPSGCTVFARTLQWTWLCLCRVIISGTTMWWSIGKVETRNSHTPTWSRATVLSASPGPFSEQRNLARWDTKTHIPTFQVDPPSSDQFQLSALNVEFLCRLLKVQHYSGFKLTFHLFRQIWKRAKTENNKFSNKYCLHVFTDAVCTCVKF